MIGGTHDPPEAAQAAMRVALVAGETMQDRGRLARSG